MRGQPVTLHDGAVVDSYSEEWRHETEARAIMNMPRKIDRQNFLWGTLDQFGKPRGGVMQIRGEAECKRLEATIMKLWKLKAANDNQPKGE